MKKYSNLRRLITDEAYYTPPSVDPALFDLANDPHEIKRGAYVRRIREETKR
jgi:hypothetical protein